MKNIFNVCLWNMVLMRNISCAALLSLAISMSFLSPASSPVVAQPVPESFADLAEQLMPAVVNISISGIVEGGGTPDFPDLQDNPFQDFFEDFMRRHNNGQPSRRRISSLGSGFVIDPSGIIITNNHVVKDADEIVVNFSDGTRYDATLIGRDAKTDIAVLQIKADKKLPFVKFGDNKKARVGDWVIAIGNPFGLGGSLSAGVISAINRDINSGPYDSYIQTDAAINRGNSGGPLFNLEGEVIGVNTAILSPTGRSVGIGFSVPADLAVNVIDQLRKYGETRRGWLGVRIQQVTDELAKEFGVQKTEGALVSEVFINSPAEKAGIKQGDVILRFGKHHIKTMRDLPRIVAETEIGEKVVVEVSRQGKKLKKTVMVERLEEGEITSDIGKPNSKKSDKLGTDTEILGMRLKPLDEATRRAAELDEGAKAVVIARIVPDSNAALAGLQAGYIVLEVDKQKAARPQIVINQIEKAREAGKESILLLLKTPSGLRFVALKITEAEN